MSKLRKILMGEMSDSEIESILAEMAGRGETTQEIKEACEVMRELVVPVEGHEDAIDNCGTGGSGLERINTSTIAAFVLAGGSVKVAKHGNRASGGRCGSFDVLEAVGANIELDARQVEKCLSEVGIGFMFAPLFHPAMKHVGPVRKKMGIRTIFNIVGPLVNPAGVERQVIGVSDLDIAAKMAKVLAELGTKKALVVYGDDSLDEITVTGGSCIFEVNDGVIERHEFMPERIYDKIGGGGKEENAEIFLGILDGEIDGAKKELVLINSAAGFLVADEVESFEEGIALAKEVLDSGKAKAKFDQYVSLTHEV